MEFQGLCFKELNDFARNWRRWHSLRRNSLARLKSMVTGSWPLRTPAARVAECLEQNESGKARGRVKLDEDVYIRPFAHRPLVRRQHAGRIRNAIGRGHAIASEGQKLKLHLGKNGNPLSAFAICE